VSLACTKVVNYSYYQDVNILTLLLTSSLIWSDWGAVMFCGWGTTGLKPIT